MTDYIITLDVTWEDNYFMTNFILLWSDNLLGIKLLKL